MQLLGASYVLGQSACPPPVTMVAYAVDISINPCTGGRSRSLPSLLPSMGVAWQPLMQQDILDIKEVLSFCNSDVPLLLSPHALWAIFGKCVRCSQGFVLGVGLRLPLYLALRWPFVFAHWGLGLGLSVPFVLVLN